MTLNIQTIESEITEKGYPDFRAGDTITVRVKVSEGGKERVQPFKGVVIQRKNAGIAETVTVRKMSGNVAVERVFPLQSPRIDGIELDRKGKVHQARIYYMRDLRGKSARIDERKKGK
jgi:large subunit ribosomal protein L19